MALFGKSNAPTPELTGEARQQMLQGRVKEYLDSLGWHYQPLENGYKLGMNLDSKLGSCQVCVRAKENRITAYAYCPIHAKPDVYANVAEFITRANYGCTLGNFEMDYDDGEIRFGAGLSCRESIPSLKDIEFVVNITFIMMDKYGDGLVKNLMGFGDPEKDIAEIERK